MTIWKQNPDLMIRLQRVQNHPAFERQDVLTFAGMCDTREELARHVAYCEERAASYVPPRRRRKVRG